MDKLSHADSQVRARGVVSAQCVDRGKLEAAKRLRRQMTPEEARLWPHLRRNRLGGLHFRRQQVIHGFIVDFYCHGAGLAVEIDGPGHEEQAEYDAERDRMLAARGLRILRVSNEAVRADVAAVLARILVAASERTDPCLE